MSDDDLTWIKHDGGPMPVPGDTVVRAVSKMDGKEYKWADWEADFFANDGVNQTIWPDIIRYAIVTPSPSQPDNINPVHYGAGSTIECIDAIQTQLTPEAFKGYLRGNIIKYVWRYEQKGGAESLEKAKWYLERLIGEVRRG